MTYVWDWNGIGRSFFTKITDHVLNQDRAFSDLLVNSDISSIRALECEFAGRHLGRLRDVKFEDGVGVRGLQDYQSVNG